MATKRVRTAYWVLFLLFFSLPVVWAILNKVRVAHYEDIFVRETPFKYVVVVQDYLVWIALAVSLVVGAVSSYEVVGWWISRTRNTPRVRADHD
jgi:hypothetical protein